MAQTEELQVDHERPPPSYRSQAESVASGSVSLLPLRHSATFKTKPTNFFLLSKEHSSIRGEFVIDPCIRVPSSILPLLGGGKTEEDRKNLSLTSKFGSVHAEIWLPGPSRPSAPAIGAPNPRRTTIALTSDHGAISAQLHTLDGAAPFSLTARTTHGSIRLAIPRSFQGLLSVSTRFGNTSLSDEIIRNATQLSQLGNARWYFIGDLYVLRDDEWQGDQVEIESTYGTIRVRYVDEVEETQGKKGLLSRLFGK